jgi:DNA end-binding protein Ku
MTMEESPVAHAIWSGSINFGLVSIPVKLYPAVRSDEGIHFHLLHDKDEGRIHNVRKCEVCSQDVPWEHVDKGWEYAKGSYVVVDDEELKKMKPEATQSIDIVEFVDASEIDTMLYDTPYYLEPEKRARRAYALLREALKKSGKVGISKVVLRTREHLAAVKPAGSAIVIELMHFDKELVDAKSFDLPPVSEKMPNQEMKMAGMLIDSMTAKFDAASFQDKYQEELRSLLEARAENKPLPKGKAKAPAAARIVNLLDVLQKSLETTPKQRASPKRRASTRPAHRKAG